jgi:protocatechuate 3,4-dioxygenase beta subunit
MTELSRRQALSALGTVSLASLLAACRTGEQTVTTAEVTTTSGVTTTIQPQTTGTLATGSLVDLFDQAATCSTSPEMTEGPFYFDVDSIRSDIREDREGAKLRLAVRVREAAACTPIANAVVDIWHCDATGLYSGFESASQGGAGGGGEPTDEETYLRGAQVTNSDGIVEFVTVYPGWYRGRTVHVHAKVHLDGSAVLTTQFYFDEAVNTEVYEGEPYASHSGRDVFNDSDGIFNEQLVLTTSPDEDGHLSLITLDVTV